MMQTNSFLASYSKEYLVSDIIMVTTSSYKLVSGL